MRMSDYSEYSYSSVTISGLISKATNFANPFVFSNLFAKVSLCPPAIESPTLSFTYFLILLTLYYACHIVCFAEQFECDESAGG